MYIYTLKKLHVYLYIANTDISILNMFNEFQTKHDTSEWKITKPQ